MTARRRIRVLIAESDARSRHVLRRVLEEDDGFEICAEVTDAAGAVSAALRERPDISVLDSRLPGGSVPATWEIGGRLPGSKVVMLAASAEDGELLAALRAGAQGYLLKTEDFGNVPAALHGVVAGEAAIEPAFVARLLRHLRIREPRWRRPVGVAVRGQAPPDAGGALRDARLTSREWEILDLLAHGMSTADIARQLTISTTAVRVHIAAIVRKLGVPDRAAAVAMLRTPGAGAGDSAARTAADATRGAVTIRVQATERPVARDAL